jgi:hypothetical protein
MTDKLSIIILRKEEHTEFWNVMKENQVTPGFMASNLLEFIYTAQLPPPLKTYLTLKFPNIVIKSANFTNGKI